MIFEEIIKEGDIYVTGYEGLVTAILQKKTASNAIDILGRQLCPDEEFYWIASIENNSGIRGAGTELLKYLVSISFHGNRTYGVDARPLRDSVWKPQNLDQRIPWLISWYRKHGFVYPKGIIDFYTFIYTSGIARDYFRRRKTAEFDAACGIVLE